MYLRRLCFCAKSVMNVMECYFSAWDGRVRSEYSRSKVSTTTITMSLPGCSFGATFKIQNARTRSFSNSTPHFEICFWRSLHRSIKWTFDDVVVCEHYKITVTTKSESTSFYNYVVIENKSWRLPSSITPCTVMSPPWVNRSKRESCRRIRPFNVTFIKSPKPYRRRYWPPCLLHQRVIIPLSPRRKWPIMMVSSLVFRDDLVWCRRRCGYVCCFWQCALFQNNTFLVCYIVWFVVYTANIIICIS